MTVFSALRRLTLLATAALLPVSGLWSPVVDASVVDRAFTSRYTFTGRVDSLLVGNSTLNCSGTGCAAAQNGTGNNNSFNMIRVDVDADATTFTSSRATLTLPAGATVRRAFLYWGGDTSAAGGGVAAPSAAARNVVRLATPAAGYATVVAATLTDSAVQATRYSAVADVTAAVTAGGSGVYTVANVQSGTGADRYGGWSLVVIVSEPSLPLRSVTLFDGSATINTASPSDLTVNVSGFRTPAAGVVGARIGLIAFEGDNGFVGDQFRVNATNAADAVNASNNAFNSTNSREGVLLTGREPQQSNLLGLDIDFIAITEGVIANNATSANLTFTTSQDVYFPVALLFQTNVFEPEIVTNFTKSANDLNGGLFRPGDEVEYLINLSNTGDDASDITVISDPLPAGVTFVPGSIEVVSGPNAGAKTDAAGDDQADYNAGTRTVTFRVGVGADQAVGGRVAPVPQANSATSVRFRAIIDADQAGNSASNIASVSFVGDTTRVPGSGSTNPSNFTVSGSADVAVTKTGPASVPAGGAISYTVTVTNAGPDAAGGTTVTDDVPNAITGVAITCSASGGAVCPPTVGLTDLTALAIPTLPSSGQVVFTISGTAPNAVTTLSNSASVALPTAITDPTPGNNTAGPVVTSVGSAAIDAVDDAGTVPNGASGGVAVPNVLANDALGGGAATLGNVTLAQLATTDARVTLDPASGAVNVAPGTPAGTYTVTYRICEAANPANCDTTTVTVTVLAAVIDAVPDVGTVPNGARGGVAVPNVLANDTVGGAAVTLATVTLTPISTTNPNVTLDPATGAVTVAPGTPAGTYTVTYQICERLNPTNCDTATVTVTVQAAVIDAVDDGPLTQPASGGTTPSVIANDGLDGQPLVLVGPGANVTLTPGTAPTPTFGSITMNPDGTVTIAPGTTPGTYTYPYTVCEILNPSNCDTATVTIVVRATIAAMSDAPPSLIPTGGTLPSIVGNDTVNGLPLVLVGPGANATLLPVALPRPARGGFVLNPDGTITVLPGTTPGRYPVEYTVCVSPATTPAICSTATVTIVIDELPAGTLVLAKVANVREASVGGVVTYTLSVANTGGVAIVDAEVVDVPPSGFSFIAGSATIDDADGLVGASGQRPIRFSGVDVPAGGRVTLRYLMRVGAAVPAGVHTNTATTFFAGLPASASAQASVITGGNTDPVFEQARLWGKVFDDRNGDGWQDDGEPGIPGVRLALVEGLIAETDRYGRYHVEGLVLSNLERGQNALVKLDVATLPPGAELTTENPLLRRLTAGLPTRFDFGVRLPAEPAATREIDLVLGEVVFAPGRSEVSDAYRPVVQRIVDALIEHGGGDIALTSDDAPDALTLRRAQALRDAVLATAPAAVAGRTRVRIDLPEGGTAAALDETLRLGTVLFDTDRTTIRPEFRDLIAGVATRIAASPVPLTVHLTGFADARASTDYNLDLSRRRAAAVADALRAALPPEARDAVRVVADDAETQP